LHHRIDSHKECFAYGVKALLLAESRTILTLALVTCKLGFGMILYIISIDHATSCNSCRTGPAKAL
jgi:hypothetical protein